MEEIWKNIEGFNGLYQVSNFGQVKKVYCTKNGRKEVVLKGGYYSNGYKFVSLTVSTNQYRNFSIHRLVAHAFVPNPENKPCVNHIDCDRANNCASNLEWVTQSENIVYGMKVGRITQRGFPRKTIVKFGEKIVEFETLTECAKFFGFKKAWVNTQIRKQGTHFNYKGYEIEVVGKGRCE